MNKTLQRGRQLKFDLAYFNLYIPLLELGHKVYFYDTVMPMQPDFERVVADFQPDLLFCCFTGNKIITPPYEPSLEAIANITKKGNIKTFNWFCDDIWRFDKFSSQICLNFTACSTPEPTCIEKFHNIGYKNILLGFWYANKDLFLNIPKIVNIGFVGGENNQRMEIFRVLANASVGFRAWDGLAVEDMYAVYASSKICLNLSGHLGGGGTQMKLRMVEGTAASAMLLTEYTPGLEEFFDCKKEIVTFSSSLDLFDKIDFYLENETARLKIAEAGYARFLREHESKVRLKKLLEQIEEI